MPRVTDVLPEATWHASHDRRREPVGGAPAQRAAVVQLFGRGIGVLAELDLGHGHESRDRHSDGAPHDAFLGETRVEDARLPELLLESLRDEMDAALDADILAEHDDLRILRELAAQRSPHRLR